MNQEVRMQAFALRCQGKTWAQIGEILNYDEQTVEKDLCSVIRKQPRRPAIRYPRLGEYVQNRCGGSIAVFAKSMKVSPHRLRRVLVNGDLPSPKLRRKIEMETELTQEEAFAIDCPEEEV